MSQQTYLLPPITAVRMVWARTGLLSNDEYSKISATLTEVALKSIRERSETDETERKYIESAIATMDATYRNLDIIYKGRELNFKENETLRQAYLDSIKENLEFGKKTSDYVKSLPAMVIGGAGGATLANRLGVTDDLGLWAAGLTCTAIGYIINRVIVNQMRKRTQMHYVTQDYERTLYYDQYISRTAITLTSLYLDLDRIHRSVFGLSYPIDVEVGDIVNDMLRGVRPTFCKYVYKHIKENKIGPKEWTICETGKQGAIEYCKHWEG